jgi:hypothetical protein
MKTIFTLGVALFCSVVLAAEPVSVLNHGQPTPAPATANASPAPARPAPTCTNGQCQLRTYNAQEYSHDVTRRRLGGGYVIRKGSRTVLRPTR